MPSIEDRLKESGRHVAIVGAFSVAGDNNNRVTTFTFGEAPAAVNFSLRAKRQERTISGIHPFMSLAISTPAESVEDGTPLPISGTALESELLKAESSPDPAAIGGKIVVDLIRSLDEQAPFWDPNFDVLLTEAYYFSRMFRRGPGEMVGGVDLHELIYEPGFNRLLTGYLRAPGEDADQIFELAKDAFPGNAFRSGTASGELIKLRDDLLDHMRDLRAWLNQATNGDSQRDKFVILQDGAKGVDAAIAREFDQKLRGLLIRGHRGKSLKEMYAAFREARDSITQIARSEPLMAFVTSWYFSAFSPSKDPREIAEQVFQKLYVEKGWKPTNIDANLEKELSDLHANGLRELHAERFGQSERPAARASTNLIKEIITEWTRLRKPGRVFRTDQLLTEMGRLFQQLSEKFIPGMEQVRELLNEEMKIFHKAEREIDANFTVAAMDGEPVDITAKLLEEKLKPVFSSLDKSFAEFQTSKSVKNPTRLELTKTLEDVLRDNNKDTGRALCEAVLKAISRHSAKIENLIMEPLSANETDINKRGEALEQSAIAEWKNALNSGGFVAAGAASGITSQDATKDDVNKRAATLPQVATLSAGLSIDLSSRKSNDSPLETPDSSAASYDPSRGLTTILPMTQKELLDIIKREDREPVTSALRPVWESLAKAQSDVLKAKRDILADDDFLNVAGIPSEAGRRALLRALIFGEHLLAAPQETSVLNKQDTSIFPKILFECMRCVGRRSEFEGSGRVALLNPSVDKDPGFADIPLKDMLQVKSVEDGPSSISNFIEYARGEAQRILELRDYLADMKDVKDLVEELSRSGDGYVTIVNDTIDARGKLSSDEIEPIYESPSDGSLPPPSIVYVTRQAFSNRIDNSLASLEQKLFDLKNSRLVREREGRSRLQIIAHDSQLGFPIYVGRNFKTERLPAIVADVERLGTLILVLCGIKRPVTNLEGAWKDMQRVTDVSAGAKDTYPQFWLRYLSESTIEPVVRSKLIAHAIATRQIERKDPVFATALVAAVNETARLVDGKDIAGLRSRTWYKDNDGGWKTVPPTASGMPVNGEKVFVVSTHKPDSSLLVREDLLFDLI